MRIPETRPMTGTGDIAPVGCERDFAIDRGTTGVEPGVAGACVEDLDSAGSGDDQNRVPVLAEPAGAVVPAIRTDEPGSGRCFQVVEIQVSAGNGEEALVRAELQVVQRTSGKREMTWNTSGCLVPDRDRPAQGSRSQPFAASAQGHI